MRIDFKGKWIIITQPNGTVKKSKLRTNGKEKRRFLIEEVIRASRRFST
jgi:hypothetical protein